MDKMSSTAVFYVIDAKTSYHMLLSRPWVHENGIVPSTWHQFFKYCLYSVVKKVFGDDKPFTDAGSHFANAKYYCHRKLIKAKESSSIEEASKKKNQDNGKALVKQRILGVESGPLEEFRLPLMTFDTRKLSLNLVKGFIRPIQGHGKEHGEFSESQATEHFGEKAYKLFVKAGYNPKDESSFGSMSSKSHNIQEQGLNATQRMSKENGHIRCLKFSCRPRFCPAKTSSYCD